MSLSSPLMELRMLFRPISMVMGTVPATRVRRHISLIVGMMELVRSSGGCMDD